MREDHEKIAEIKRAISSEFLTEKSAFNNVSSTRRLPVDRWKGMTPNEVAQIRQAQLEQIENKRVSG